MKIMAASVVLAAIANSGCRNYLAGASPDWEISGHVDDADPATSQAGPVASTTEKSVQKRDGESRVLSLYLGFNHLLGISEARPGPAATTTPLATTKQAAGSAFTITDAGTYRFEVDTVFDAFLEDGSGNFQVGLSVMDDQGNPVGPAAFQIEFGFSEDPADNTKFRLSLNGQHWMSLPDGTVYRFNRDSPPFALAAGKYRFRLESHQRAGGDTRRAKVQGSVLITLKR